MAASFPTTVPTTAELRGDLVDNVSSPLSGAITDSVTTIPIDSAASFPSAGLASIKKANGTGFVEVISYTGKTANTLTGVTRNFNGLGASAYVEDDIVHLYWVANHHNRFVEEVIAIAQNINDRVGLDDGTGDLTTPGAGKGLVVTTPNGSNTYRLAISNDGVLTTEQIT